MAITFPINPLHGDQYAPQGIPVTWQFDSGRNAWRVMRAGPAWFEIAGKPDSFPPGPHDHPIAEVIGLQGVLDGKQDISARGQINGYAPLNEEGKVPENMLSFGALSWDNIPDKPSVFPPEPHTHPVAEISDSGTTGQQLVRAPAPSDARAIIGAIGIDDNARISVDKNSAIIGVRRGLNFIEGANITMSIVDDPAEEEVEITINSSGGGGGSALTVSEIKPVAPTVDMMWLDTATGILFTYYNDGSSSQWIESLPYLNSMPTVFTKFDFPPAPIDNQLYNPIPGATWKWSATRGVWFAVSNVSDAYTKAESDTKFVDIVGDVMTGPLSVVHPPTANTHAASKQYVDSRPGLTVSDTPPAGAVDGALWWESDTGLLYVRYNDGSSTQWVLTSPQPDLSTFALDTAVVHKSGDTMTGHLGLPTGPAAGQAVRKDYADTKVQIAGDTMTGPLILNADPSATLGAATKQYVDNKGAFPAGTIMLFYNAAAPTGWTKLTAGADNRAIRVVSGSGGVGGGVQPFSTAFGRTGTDNFTISTNEMPSHTHLSTSYSGINVLDYWQAGSWDFTPGGQYRAPLSGWVTSAVGASAAHSHTIDLRVQYLDVILCQKN